MYTILGLGNPGEEYSNTRHNVGRDISQSIISTYGEGSKFKADNKSLSLISNCFIENTEVRVVLPETFMNRSGLSARYFIKDETMAAKLIVIHDDLDLPLGTIRLSYGRGAGGHHGVESIISSLHTRDFIRIRVGVSKTKEGQIAKPRGEDAVQDFVLGRFDKREATLFIDVRKKAIDAVAMIIKKGLERAMEEYNRS